MCATELYNSVQRSDVYKRVITEVCVLHLCGVSEAVCPYMAWI